MRGQLVSIVIPTYNYARFVAEAVESVLAQSYPSREIIVVDDGSTDDTHARLLPFADCIRYVRQENQGLSAARNTGIRLARGNLIALLDSDDVWHPRKLELQLDYLERHREVMLLGTDCLTGDRTSWPELNEAIPADPVYLEGLILRSYFAPSTAILRRECLDAVGRFDTSLRSVEDRDLWIRVAARFRVAVLRAPLCWYRLHEGNMSKAASRMETYERRVLDQAFAMIESLRGRWLLRRKALSHALASSAWMYRESGENGTALRRLFRSLALWPLPYPRSAFPTRLARLRLLAALMRSTLMPATPQPRSEP